MKIPPLPHRWSVSPRVAIAIQKRLSSRVEQKRPKGRFRWIAGADAAFSLDGRMCMGAVVLWDTAGQTVAERRFATRRLAFPYVPGLLSFREAPALLAALRKLRRAPDALILDGHGFAHPRRFGIACHVGVLCDLPAIGCAKSPLTGRFRDPGWKRGSSQWLLDGDDTVGSVLRTQDGIRPVFVSVGHKVDLATAEKIVLDCSTRYRLPEPTRLADRWVAELKRSR